MIGNNTWLIKNKNTYKNLTFFLILIFSKTIQNMFINKIYFVPIIYNLP